MQPLKLPNALAKSVVFPQENQMRQMLQLPCGQLVLWLPNFRLNRRTRHSFLMAQTIQAPAASELIIKKSRFLGRVQPVTDRAHALRELSLIRHQHPVASHVCWALMAGGHSAAVDDGEPSGTAGRPMLEVLRHQQLEGVLASVVRYYGGINLGAGGLVRAYTDAVAQALKNATKVTLTPQKRLGCLVPYPLEGLFRNRMLQGGVTLLAIDRGLELKILIQGPEDQVAEVVKILTNESQGRILWFGD